MDWRGDFYSQALAQATAEGLTNAAEYLRAKSVPRAPVDTAALRQSAQVTPAAADDLESAVSYDTPYAAKQHDDLQLHHWNGGEPLYLLRPLVEEQDTLFRLIQRPIGRIQ